MDQERAVLQLYDKVRTMILIWPMLSQLIQWISLTVENGVFLDWIVLAVLGRSEVTKTPIENGEKTANR